MGERVLLVDDEQRLLDGLRRNLRGRYAITTASCGQEGLTALSAAVQEANPFAVVVSDMQMPGMSGAQFLTQAHTLVPDTVLMILSGQADLTSTIAAVNDANLFRFLTKPIEPDDLITALDAGLRQNQLVTAERELLQNTLTGAVGVLTDVLSMASPGASQRTERVRTVVRAAAEMLSVQDDWRLPVAAMLSHIGCISVPGHVLDQLDAGTELDPAERDMWRSHPQIGQRLLERIPRLHDVARWVGNQPTSQAAADADGEPDPDVSASVLPAVAAVLVHRDAGIAPRDGVRRLTHSGKFPTAVLEAVLAAVGQAVPGGTPAQVMVNGLMPGMVIDADVQTAGGMVLVRRGERVTDVLIARLTNFAATVGLKEPFGVLVEP
jgi:DNA-binding response OmpR family regulator